MSSLATVATTVRQGVPVHDIRITSDTGSDRGYLLAPDGSESRPIVVVAHGERGDRSELLLDAIGLRARGLAVLLVDAAAMREAAARRDPASALRAGLLSIRAAVSAAMTEPGVDPDRVGVVGRGLAGEAIAKVASERGGCTAAVAIAPLPHRARFLSESDRPVAVGFRRRHGLASGDATLAPIAEIGEAALADHLTTAAANWLVQWSADDRRVTPDERREFVLGAPDRTEVELVDTRAELMGSSAVQARASFLADHLLAG